jgi:hypothetical protein
MKRKYLLLATAGLLLAAAGLWIARFGPPGQAVQRSTAGADFKTPSDLTGHPTNAAGSVTISQAGPAIDSDKYPHLAHTPRPPVPNRRFTDFTPEQRVQFARHGHGPGG